MFKRRTLYMVASIIGATFYLSNSAVLANEQTSSQGQAQTIFTGNQGSSSSGSSATASVANIAVQNNNLSDFVIGNARCSTGGLAISAFTSDFSTSPGFSATIVFPFGGQTKRECLRLAKAEADRQELSNYASLTDKCIDWIKSGVDPKSLPGKLGEVCSSIKFKNE